MSIFQRQQLEWIYFKTQHSLKLQIHFLKIQFLPRSEIKLGTYFLPTHSRYSLISFLRTWSHPLALSIIRKLLIGTLSMDKVPKKTKKKRKKRIQQQGEDLWFAQNVGICEIREFVLCVCEWTQISWTPCLDHGCLGKLDPSEEVKLRFAFPPPNFSLLEKQTAAAGE